MPTKDTSTLIIGASIPGLASAACLQKKNIGYAIIEKQGEVDIAKKEKSIAHA